MNDLTGMAARLAEELTETLDVETVSYLALLDALASKVLRPPEGTTVQLGFQNGYPIVRFITEVEHAA